MNNLKTENENSDLKKINKSNSIKLIRSDMPIQWKACPNKYIHS